MAPEWPDADPRERPRRYPTHEPEGASPPGFLFEPDLDENEALGELDRVFRKGATATCTFPLQWSGLLA